VAQPTTTPVIITQTTSSPLKMSALYGIEKAYARKYTDSVDFAAKLSDQPTEKELDNFITARITQWNDTEDKDELLWDAFTMDFDHWTLDYFERADKTILRQLRDYLRTWGVYVPRNRDNIAAKI
jgi:hypothetical protein